MTKLMYRLRDNNHFTTSIGSKTLKDFDCYNADRANIVEIIEVTYTDTYDVTINQIFADEKGLPTIEYEWVVKHHSVCISSMESHIMKEKCGLCTWLNEKFCTFTKNPQPLLDLNHNWELVGTIRR